jgi:sorbitol-specific phosphotransferase system component IIA
MSEGHHEKKYKIVVNGTPTPVDKEVLSFDDVVNIAFPTRDPNTIYSVSFEHAKEPKEGELLPGHSVTIKENTEFDVDDTGKS